MFFQWKKPEHHVQECWGKQDRRRTCGDETEVSMFGIMKFERESISHIGFGYIIQTGELHIGLEFWSDTPWEIRARQRKLSVKFASVAQRWQSFAKYRETGPKCESAVKYREFGERSTESSHRGEVDPPQSRDLQYLIHWESLRVCSTKVESFRRRPDAGAIRQCIHRVIICPQQWKQRYILERTTITTWSPTRTPIPKSSRRCSISRRNWSWTRSTRSITSPRLNGNVLPWWDYLCYMTKYSSCQKQRYVSIQTESGKDARTFRGHDKMERTTPICSGFQWIQRIIQNRRRTI